MAADKAPEDGLLGYSGILSLRFTNLSSFREICDRHADRLSEGVEACEYLGFRGVPVATFDAIDEMRERGSLPRMRILYDGDEEILIAKLVGGVTHAVATTEFGRMFLSHAALPGNALANVRSARFGDSRSKEADAAYKPRSRSLESDWPSIVVEVGVSLAQLQRDALFWLTKSGGKARIVIVLAITETGPRKLHIERWENGPALMQSITLQENVPYTGSSLVIPVAGIFDVVAGALPRGELEFDAQDLSTFNDDLWSLLG